MKKFFSAAIVALIVSFAANCSAYDYDKDPDYVWVTNQQGSFYLYLPSIDVQEYNPPYYQIAGNFVWTNGMRESRQKIVIRYDFKRKETFSRDKNGYWRKDDTSDKTTASRSNRKIADALFIAAYGMSFYGN